MLFWYILILLQGTLLYDIILRSIYDMFTSGLELTGSQMCVYQFLKISIELNALLSFEYRMKYLE